MVINPIVGVYIPVTRIPLFKGGGFKTFVIFTPKPGEMIQFDEHIVPMGGSTTN